MAPSRQLWAEGDTYLFFLGGAGGLSAAAGARGPGPPPRARFQEAGGVPCGSPALGVRVLTTKSGRDTRPAVARCPRPCRSLQPTCF